MFNLLCFATEDFEGIGSLVFGVIALIFIAIKFIKQNVNNIVNDADNDDDNGKYPFGTHPNQTGQLTPEQRRYQSGLQQRKSSQKPATTPVTGTDGHSHHGTVETYDPIVGSLGDVDDEGCDELDGVRLIATDLMYETDDDGKVYDLNAIRKSLIIGEVLNNPRFKKPHGKR